MLFVLLIMQSFEECMHTLYVHCSITKSSLAYTLKNPQVQLLSTAKHCGMLQKACIQGCDMIMDATEHKCKSIQA